MKCLKSETQWETSEGRYWGTWLSGRWRLSINWTVSYLSWGDTDIIIIQSAMFLSIYLFTVFHCFIFWHFYVFFFFHLLTFHFVFLKLILFTKSFWFCKLCFWWNSLFSVMFFMFWFLELCFVFITCNAALYRKRCFLSSSLGSLKGFCVEWCAEWLALQGHRTDLLSSAWLSPRGPSPGSKLSASLSNPQLLASGSKGSLWVSGSDQEAERSELLEGGAHMSIKLLSSFCF